MYFNYDYAQQNTSSFITLEMRKTLPRTTLSTFSMVTVEPALTSL